MRLIEAMACGVPVVERIDAALAARRPMPVAFVNADCLNTAVLDVAYRETLSAMGLCCRAAVACSLASRTAWRTG